MLSGKFPTRTVTVSFSVHYKSNGLTVRVVVGALHQWSIFCIPYTDSHSAICHILIGTAIPLISQVKRQLNTVCTDMSITLNDVYTETFDARNEWQNILLALKVDSPTIESISVKCQNNSDKCYREGLDRWLKSGKRNWEDVINALRSPTVKHFKISMNIEKLHGTEDQTAASNVVQHNSQV